MKRFTLLCFCLLILTAQSQAKPEPLKLEFGRDTKGLYLVIENTSRARVTLPYGHCGHLGWFSAVVYQPESGPLFSLPWKDVKSIHPSKVVVLQPGERQRKYIPMEFPDDKGKVRAVLSTPSNIPSPKYWVGEIRSNWLE